MDEFNPGAEHDQPQSDPYDGLGETEFYQRMYDSQMHAERVHFGGAEVEPW